MFVHSIFRSIQGEGPDVGRPAVFVRLAGCNLNCPWCDTDHSQKRFLGPGSIAEEVCGMLQDAGFMEFADERFVVLTGGEPFAQPIVELTRILQEATCEVQIETNGTLWQDIELGGPLSIVCSPKLGSMVHPRIASAAKAFKFVLDQSDCRELMTRGEAGALLYASEGLELILSSTNSRPLKTTEVWIQPKDVGDETANKDNALACVEFCLETGCHFSFQVHKALGLE